MRTDPAQNKEMIALPETPEIREAYEKVSYLDRLRKSIISTTNILIVVAALAILVAMLFLPVLRIYGESMNATLKSGELVVSVKGSKFKTGDIVAFYYNNNILVKRVMANSGDWVDIELAKLIGDAEEVALDCRGEIRRRKRSVAVVRRNRKVDWVRRVDAHKLVLDLDILRPGPLLSHYHLGYRRAIERIEN